jgi:hypothetical protein
MVVEKAVSQWGLPNGYVLGQEASGAFIGANKLLLLKMLIERAKHVCVYWSSWLLSNSWRS